MSETQRVNIPELPVWAEVPSELKNFIGEDFRNVEYDVDEALKSVRDVFSKREMFAVKNNYRSKLDEFTTRSGQKPAGASNVNIVGLYQVGDVPKYDDISSLGIRSGMQDCYAEAIAKALTEVTREMGFTPSPRDEYPDFDTAKIAVEMESVSSKGPYDRGSKRTAFISEENNLKDAHTDFVWSEEQLKALAFGLDGLRSEYARHPGIHKSMLFEPWRFASVMAERGISSTYRGGINASGDSIINLSQVRFSSWIMQRIKGLTIHDVHTDKELFDLLSTEVEVGLPTEDQAHKSEILSAVRAHIIDKYTVDSDDVKCLNPTTFESDGFVRIRRVMTVDELVSHTMFEIFHEQQLTVAEYVKLCGYRLNIMGNLQRDQGSPYLYKWDGKKWYVDGRKDRKYRMVIPVMVWVQAVLIAACHEIMDVAPEMPWRIGLLHPTVNTANMKKHLKDCIDRGMFNDSHDLSRFDAGITDQPMTMAGLMYASLYTDSNVKQALSLLGWWSMDKIMILAKPVTNPDPIWSEYKHIPIPSIRGSRSNSITRAMLHANDPLLQREAEAALARGAEEDYTAVALHVGHTWEPSGIFMTNTSESDVHAAVQCVVIPCELLKLPEVTQDVELSAELIAAIENRQIKAITSGDDVLVAVLITMLERIGLTRTRELYTQAYSAINWTMNDKKLSKVTILTKVGDKQIYLPVAEFLQQIMNQNPDNGTDIPRRKFMRALPALWYTERNSKLPLPMQYTSIDGRLNNALTTNEKDMEFAARMIVSTGKHYRKLIRERRYRVARSKGVKGYVQDANTMFYDPACEAGRSELLGLDNYLSYVKKYGDQFVSQLSRRFAEINPGKMVRYTNDLTQELEARAPHRRNLMSRFYEAFSAEEREFLFKGEKTDSLPTVEPVVGDLLIAIEKLGVTIPPLSLDADDGQISEREVVDDLIKRDDLHDDPKILD